MTLTSSRRLHPVSMRLPDADLALIDRAATLRGRSRTDFVREAAVQAAEDVLMQAGLVRMSPQGFTAFMQTLSAPAAAVPPMVDLLRRPAPWDDTGTQA